MKMGKLFKCIGALFFTVLLNIITANQTQATVVHYYARVNHIDQGSMPSDYISRSNLLTANVGDYGIDEYIYSHFTDESATLSFIDYDSSMYSLSFSSSRFDSPGLILWLSNKKETYKWDGIDWIHTGPDVSTYLPYDSYYTLNTPILTPVPEPSTVLLMGLGIIGMGYAKRRKARSLA